MPYLGQRPSKGDENNFKILDDISSYTLTFDGSDSSVVSAANDTITSLTHRFVQGQRVTYNKGGGTVITGLSDGVYYIIKEDHNTIKLATSASNASNGVAVNITGVGAGSSHTLNVAFDGINTKFKATHTNGQKARITRSAQLVISINGVIQQPHDTATPSTGFGFDLDGTIVFSQAPVSTDEYWAHVLTNNNVTFDISNNDIDNFTGDGSTTEFNLSKTPPDNRNILVTIDGVVQYPNDPDGTARAYVVVENVLTFNTAPDSGVEIQVRHIGFAGSTSGGSGVTNFYGRTGSVVLKNTDNITVNDAAITGDATVTGNLTINGDFTTLNTTLREVELLRVDANNDSAIAGIITQSGAGHGFYVDGTTILGNSQYVPTFNASTQLAVANLSGNNNSVDMTILGGRTGKSMIRFGDHDSNDRGSIQYHHTDETIKFYNNGNTITPRLTIHTDGKVGIGTTNPQAKLDIYDNSAGLGGIIQVTQEGAGDAAIDFQLKGTREYTLGIDNSDSDKFKLSGSAGLANNTLLTVTNSGDVGIGTQIPESTLDVVSLITPTGITARTISTQSTNTNKALKVRNNSTTDTFNVSYRGQGYFAGDVGIGTNNPTQKLDVRGNAIFLNSGDDTSVSIGETVGNNNAYIDFRGDSTYTDYGLRVLRNDGGANATSDFRHRGTGAIRIVAEDAGSIQFFTSGTASSNERLRITSGGNVNIGGSYTQTTTKFHVEGKASIKDTGGDVLELESTTNTSRTTLKLLTNGNDWEIGARGSSGNPNNSFYIYDNAANEYRTVINPSGKVGIGTDNPTAHLQVYRKTAFASNPIIQARSNNGSTNELKFQIDGDGDAYFNGNVGIGTDNPSTEFHVHDGNSVLVSLFESKTDHSRVRIKAPENKLSQLEFADDDADAGEIRYDHANDKMTFHVRANNEKLGITSTGQVTITGADDQDNFIVDASLTQFKIHQDATDGEISLRAEDGSGNNYAKYMTFFVEGGSGSVERLRISSIGNVSVGTQTNAGNTLRYLDVANYFAGPDAGSILRLLSRNSNDTANVGLDIVKYKAGAARLINYETLGDNGFIAFSTGVNGGTPTEKLRITSRGTTISGGSIPSDAVTYSSSFRGREGVIGPIYYWPRVYGVHSNGGGYDDIAEGNRLELRMYGALGGTKSMFQNGFDADSYGAGGEALDYNRVRVIFRVSRANTTDGYNANQIQFSMQSYYYSSGWADISNSAWVFSGTDGERGYRWTASNWISGSDFAGGFDVPSIAIKYNDDLGNLSNSNIRIAAVYLQYAYFN